MRPTKPLPHRPLGQPQPHQGPGPGVLQVQFRHLRSEGGWLRVALFAGPKGFPESVELAYRTAVLRPTGRVAQHTFTGLPPGRYALGYYHDENANGVLDKNILGQPTEDYGFSGGAKGLFSAPKFSEAAFELPPQGLALAFRVQRVRPFV